MFWVRYLVRLCNSSSDGNLSREVLHITGAAVSKPRVTKLLDFTHE
jgi:hypothetical protein